MVTITIDITRGHIRTTKRLWIVIGKPVKGTISVDSPSGVNIPVMTKMITRIIYAKMMNGIMVFLESLLILITSHSYLSNKISFKREINSLLTDH